MVLRSLSEAKNSVAIEVEALLLFDKQLFFNLDILAEVKGDVSMVHLLLICIFGGGGRFG